MLHEVFLFFHPRRHLLLRRGHPTSDTSVVSARAWWWQRQAYCSTMLYWQITAYCQVNQLNRVINRGTGWGITLSTTVTTTTMELYKGRTQPNNRQWSQQLHLKKTIRVRCCGACWEMRPAQHTHCPMLQYWHFTTKLFNHYHTPNLTYPSYVACWCLSYKYIKTNLTAYVFSVWFRFQSSLA